MSFPWSYSVLGLVPGYVDSEIAYISKQYLESTWVKLTTRCPRLIFTVFVALIVLYT